MGFEPTRAEHIGLAVQRLNHSATSSHSMKKALYWCVIALTGLNVSPDLQALVWHAASKKYLPRRELNPGPLGESQIS
jgi:hypothetical protein